jgi:polysaccharide deacetylase 2 family uncharacterized protein YibQ
MMAIAGGFGLGFVGADEAAGRSPDIPTGVFMLPNHELAERAAAEEIEVADLPPVDGDAIAVVLGPAGAAHAPHDIPPEVWLAMSAEFPAPMAGNPEVPASEDVDLAAVALDTSYDEALEPQRATEQEAFLRPDLEPALPDTDLSPAIAIVIDDLGLNRRQTAAVTALPAPLTMSFMPYAEDLAAQTEAAASAGHEIFLHLPMEPVDSSKNPGPNALLASLSADELATRLVENLDRFSGYVGVNNHMGSRLTQDPAAMAIVMAELKRRDVMFLDSVTIGGSIAYETAVRFGIPAAERDVFLDNEPEVGAILQQLRLLERDASHQGFAIAIGHPNGATVKALAQWIPDAIARGYRIVPVSEIIDDRSLLVAQYANDGS